MTLDGGSGLVLSDTHRSVVEVPITRIYSTTQVESVDLVSFQAPLEIQLRYGSEGDRRNKLHP